MPLSHVEQLLHGAKWTDIAAEHTADCQGKDNGNEKQKEIPSVPLEEDILHTTQGTEDAAKIETDQDNRQQENPFAILESLHQKSHKGKQRESTNDGNLDQLIMDEVGRRRTFIGCMCRLKHPCLFTVSKRPWLIEPLADSRNGDERNEDEGCQ